MKYSTTLFLLLCIIIAVFYFIGVLFFLTDHESDNKCEMTYMFEYPQYVRVSQNIDEKYPKYGLYAYGEGRMTKKARYMYFDGIPVLFIPGNGGSHQQVRSLSSVALRKALNSGTPYHFDYFTVDLNSEFSALYGPVLYEQLEYVLSSIDRIFELYKDSPSSPKQVVLIGHSVGGIVAKKAIAELLKSKRNVVSVLITLAAPIKRAPLYFDRQISSFYKTSVFDKETIITISIGGGHSDMLVPSYLTETVGNNTLNLVATNIPKAWVESNHVQILWCKQIVLAINRALFDSVDRQSRQISTDTAFIRRVFNHHLVYNSGTEHHFQRDFKKLTKISYKGEWIESLYKQYSVEHKKGLRVPHWYMVGFSALPTYEMLTVLAVNLEVTDWVFACNAAFPNGPSRVCGTEHHFQRDFKKLTKISYKGEWIESLYKQYSVEHKKGLRVPHWYMVGFSALPTYEMLTVLAVNLEVTDWVFACNAAFPNGPSRVCVEAEHLTQYSEIVPTTRFKRRLITIKMHELRKNNTEYSHVVFRALPTTKPVTFHVDIYGSFERKTEISLPRFPLSKQIILSQTPEKALVYDVILPELENQLQVYQLFVEPIRCSLERHHATASLILPWANENVHSHFTETLNKPFIIRLQNSKPQDTDHAKVRLTLDPTCTYKVSIRLHILGCFGQIARYYSTFLIINVAVVFLLGFQKQISHMGKTGTVPILFTALIDGLKQSWILPVIYLLLNVSYPFWTNILPQPEFMALSNDRVNMIMPLIMFMISIVIVFILVVAYCVSLFALESTVHKLTLKLLARTVTFTPRFSDYFMTFLQKVPFIVAAVLVALCFITCGGLALCLGMIFYFLKLTQISQEYVEQVAWFVAKKIAKKCKRVFSKNKKESKDIPANKTFEKTTVVENAIKPCASNNDHIENPIEDVDDKNNIDNTKQNLNGNDSDSTRKEASHKHTNNSTTQLKNKEETKDLLEGELTIKPESQAKNISAIEQEQPKEENSERGSVTNLSSTNNALFFHSSMFFIWVFVTILNIPAVLTWAHNFKYNKHLIPDESFFPGLVLSLSALPLWQLDLPRTNRKFTSHLRIIILCFIIVSLLYATVSVYRLNYMFTILFALIMVQQSYAPKIYTGNEDAFDNADEKQKENKYDDIKMKMD